MYDVSLDQSLFEARTDTPFRSTTFAEILREQADLRGNATALR